jgi:hypothetical protein
MNDRDQGAERAVETPEWRPTEIIDERAARTAPIRIERGVETPPPIGSGHEPTWPPPG